MQTLGLDLGQASKYSKCCWDRLELRRGHGGMLLSSHSERCSHRGAAAYTLASPVRTTQDVVRQPVRGDGGGHGGHRRLVTVSVGARLVRDGQPRVPAMPHDNLIVLVLLRPVASDAEGACLTANRRCCCSQHANIQTVGMQGQHRGPSTAGFCQHSQHSVAFTVNPGVSLASDEEGDGCRAMLHA